MAQTESATLGWVTDGKLIVDLPLANRNFTPNPGTFSRGCCGVAKCCGFGQGHAECLCEWREDYVEQLSFRWRRCEHISENSFSGFDPETGIAIPAPDTIAEFKVQTGMYDASYGRGSGATSTLLARAGAIVFMAPCGNFPQRRFEC